MYGRSNNIPCACFSVYRFIQPTTGVSLCILVLFNLLMLYTERKGTTCPVRFQSIFDTSHYTWVQVRMWVPFLKVTRSYRIYTRTNWSI